jgi:LPXTG-site transpeptidase (sortase) family protein
MPGEYSQQCCQGLAKVGNVRVNCGICVVIDWPRKRRRVIWTRQTCFMVSVELVVLVVVAWRLTDLASDSSTGATTTRMRPAPTALSMRDVLPTPTPDFTIPARLIMFPGASMSAPIIPAGRVGGTWETRHLGDSVGHLIGTSWLDGPGNNIVLAGHVETPTGEPGPFAHLFEAKEGDLVILREGDTEVHYRVTAIEEVGPYDVGYVAQTGNPRLTLITCTDWDYKQATYLGRLVVIAEPVIATAQGSQ